MGWTINPLILQTLIFHPPIIHSFGVFFRVARAILKAARWGSLNGWLGCDLPRTTHPPFISPWWHGGEGGIGYNLIACPHLVVWATSKQLLPLGKLFLAPYGQRWPLDVTSVGRNYSLVADTSKCGWAITFHPFNIETWPMWVCCWFVSNDLKYTNLGPLKLIPLSNQFAKVTSKTHTISRLTLDEWEVCLYTIITSPFDKGGH